MVKLRIFLYRLYKSEILLILWAAAFIAQYWLPRLKVFGLFLIFHILIGMYFRRNELTAVQYGVRIGVILAVTCDLVMSIL